MAEIVKKKINGFVVQTFENGICIDQDFIAGEEEIEDEEGEIIDETDLEHSLIDFPLNMVQPNDMSPYDEEEG